MPCDGSRGLDYIDAAVEQHYSGSWRDALAHFVLDETNKWCPRWVCNNYQVLNKDFLAQTTEGSSADASDDSSTASRAAQGPTADKTKKKKRKNTPPHGLAR